jgi:hypothetical protein
MQVFLKIFFGSWELGNNESEANNNLGSERMIYPGFFALLRMTVCVLRVIQRNEVTKNLENLLCYPGFFANAQNDDCVLVCHSETNEVKSKNPDIYNNSLRSFHKGLLSSIRANFFFLLIHFKCFSRSIASVIVENSCYRTKLWMWYFLVNHSMRSYLCS